MQATVWRPSRGESEGEKNIWNLKFGHPMDSQFDDHNHSFISNHSISSNTFNPIYSYGNFHNGIMTTVSMSSYS